MEEQGRITREAESSVTGVGTSPARETPRAVGGDETENRPAGQQVFQTPGPLRLLCCNCVCGMGLGGVLTSVLARVCACGLGRGQRLGFGGGLGGWDSSLAGWYQPPCVSRGCRSLLAVKSRLEDGILRGSRGMAPCLCLWSASGAGWVETAGAWELDLLPTGRGLRMWGRGETESSPLAG